MPSASQNPRLRFWHWYSLSSADYGKVQIKVDGTRIGSMSFSQYISTSGTIWTYTYLYIYLIMQDNQLKLHFTFMQSIRHFNNVSSGWYIDDIIIQYDNQQSSENNIQTFSFGTPPQTGDAVIDAITIPSILK